MSSGSGNTAFFCLPLKERKRVSYVCVTKSWRDQSRPLPHLSFTFITLSLFLQRLIYTAQFLNAWMPWWSTVFADVSEDTAWDAVSHNATRSTLHFIFVKYKPAVWLKTLLLFILTEVFTQWFTDLFVTTCAELIINVCHVTLPYYCQTVSVAYTVSHTILKKHMQCAAMRLWPHTVITAGVV